MAMSKVPSWPSISRNNKTSSKTEIEGDHSMRNFFPDKIPLRLADDAPEPNIAHLCAYITIKRVYPFLSGVKSYT